MVYLNSASGTILKTSRQSGVQHPLADTIIMFFMSRKPKPLGRSLSYKDDSTFRLDRKHRTRQNNMGKHAGNANRMSCKALFSSAIVGFQLYSKFQLRMENMKQFMNAEMPTSSQESHRRCKC
ncbi:hypothetical protein AVEN_274134-1 [Araneus ventricosus]|uniref:Uncharacterized protein n=1 Tax=Araneus ventricosus TaxID=182803 RepID=A0A4Y2TRK2_ARAVE|nr:hypothetical protein AVEN_274134-1 [Araneus ventricosus]